MGLSGRSTLIGVGLAALTLLGTATGAYADRNQYTGGGAGGGHRGYHHRGYHHPYFYHPRHMHRYHHRHY